MAPVRKKRKHQMQRELDADNGTGVRVHGARITKAQLRKVAGKTRRPGRKLKAAEDLGGMRDALPEVSDEEGEWEGFSDGGDGDASATATPKRRRKRAGAVDGTIKMRSLPHRPGAMKRKRKMEGLEMERFGRNLAQLAANTKASGEVEKEDGDAASVDEGSGGGASSKEKWAALRSFIGSTLERKDGFPKS